MTTSNTAARSMRMTTARAAAGGVPWAILGAGLFGLLLLIIAATAVRADIIESTVAARTSSALADSDISVGVDIDGRDVVLRGIVASAEDRRRALEIADAAWGSRVVRDDLTVVPVMTAKPERISSAPPAPPAPQPALVPAVAPCVAARHRK